MPLNPFVYLEITVGSQKIGRIVFELFSDITPKTVENFRGLCTGEYGLTKTSGKPLHFLGCKFFKVLKGMYIQSGDIENNNGDGGESVYGLPFKDENYIRRHSQAGVLSMANCGKHNNTSQFVITLKKMPHLDGKCVVFGQVVEGMEIIRAIEAIPIDSDDTPRVPITISGCGETKLIISKPKNKALTEARQQIENLLGTSSGNMHTQSRFKDINIHQEHEEFDKRVATHKKNENAAQKGLTSLNEAIENAHQLSTEILEAQNDKTTHIHSIEIENKISSEVSGPFKNDKERKLFDLRLRMNQSRKLNNKEVIEEKRKNADPNYANKLVNPNKSNKKENKVDEALMIPKGKEYLHETLSSVEYRNSKQDKKQNSFGWNVFNQEALYRAHKKRLNEMPFQVEDYKRQKKELGDKFYNTQEALISATFKPTEEAKDRLVENLDKQQNKRSQYSRHRMMVEEKEVSYINKRNRVYNEKLERSFGVYSAEIKQNLERGTAL